MPSSSSSSERRHPAHPDRPPLLTPGGSSSRGSSLAPSDAASADLPASVYPLHSPVLNATQLRRLEKHQYSCSNESFLDPPLQIWWNYVVTLVPLWMAPNLITLVGLVINIATSILLMWQCPTATEDAPGLTTLACAVGLFAYQTLDAIDGKQARRTGSQSPLGELFDHGCDSLSTVFVTMACACSVSLGHNPVLLLMQCFTATFLFYIAQWQTYVTGTMRFGRVDVTEAQVSVMIVMLANTIFGSQFWSMEISGFPVRAMPTIVGVVLSGWSLVQTLEIICTGGAGKNGATIAGTSVITPVIPIALVMVPGVIIARYSSEGVFDSNPILFILTWGVMASKVTNKLIVAMMTKAELNHADIVHLVPVAYFVRYYCHLDAIISEKQLLVASAVFVCIDVLLYCAQVCIEVATHLGIEVLRIKPPRQTPSN